MPLIVSSLLRRGFSLKAGVSPVYISVDKKYLSSQYELISLGVEYWVHGTIMGVSRLHGPLSSDERRVIEEHVIGRNARFYLSPGLFLQYDSLYFDEESWAVLRDAGIFPDEYRVRAKLLRVEAGEPGKPAKEIALYPYRDVEAPEA
ncbi:MAG: hypothetical protein ABWW69_04575 [Pyrodictiaceae archaeon]